MKNKRVTLFLSVLSLVLIPAFGDGADRKKELKELIDSLEYKIGEKGFMPCYERCLELAQEQKESKWVEQIYTDGIDHYYRLGNMDSLKIFTFQYMEWCAEHQKENPRYLIWRQYIQRLTEMGMKDEALNETERLRKDAETKKSKYGLACSEMSIGYNHRIFSNDVKLCLNYYNSALTHFKESENYEDAVVVSLNIVQINLARSEYKDAIRVLGGIEELEKIMSNKDMEIRIELRMRYYQFRVIATLASKGEKAAAVYIKQTDNLYADHPRVTPKDAWYGYKILCAKTTNNIERALHYTDSLQEYHRSIGSCYPSNYLMKAQYLELLGRFSAACRVYQEYAQVNDSVRSAEFDDKLSKYTVEFEVNKLERDKLELEARMNRNLLVTSLIVGGMVLLLLLVITRFYMRSLALNKKLDAANKDVIRASRMKSSFIQHITHEIRTPLNSIIGFSSLIADGGLEPDEIKEYSVQMEKSNVYLLDLVNNVIDIADMDSQAEELPKKEVNVGLCCNECLEMIRLNLKENVVLEYFPSSESLTLQTVYPWMKRVLLVLLNNANKFTESGFIRLRYEEDREKRLVRFVVEDSGVGVKEEHKEAIFDRFVKLDNFSQGTGLGLPIVKQIMELMDGNVFLDTSYTGGARFVVEWPI